MPSLFAKVVWILNKVQKSAIKHAAYYFKHPREAWEDLRTYARENPKEFAAMCALVAAGVLVIVVPLIIGFGPAGVAAGSIAAGIQAGMGGTIVAGSAFAVIQSLAMTGVFTAVGLTLIGSGIRLPLMMGIWRWAWKGVAELFDKPKLWYLSR